VRRVWLLGSLMACNAVFDIEETGSLPPENTDRDGDGVDDLDDLCPDLVNSGADEDRDGIGDECDNCPLLENVSQADADVDGVGDVCDPHPLMTGDCLAVLDGLNTPAAFATHWEVRSAGIPAPAHAPIAGGVHVDVPGGADLAFVAKALAGSYDAQLLASFDITVAGGGVSLVTDSSAAGGITCTASYNGLPEMPQPIQLTFSSPMGMDGGGGAMSTRRLGSRLMIRVGATSASGSYVPRCRVDHGVAAGTTSLGEKTKLAVGTVELSFRDVTGDVYAVAAYTFEAGRELCPAAVIR